MSVVAAFAPLAEAALRVGGERVSVRDLTPPGAEPHDLELTPDALDRVLDADLAVVTGGGFQPAVEDAISQRDGRTLAVLEIDGMTEVDRSEKDAERGSDLSNDPHVWLDPVRMEMIVDAVAAGLSEVDPKGSGAYRANAARFDAELNRLDGELASGLSHCEGRTVLTSHDAFGWLALRYGLDTVGVVGISPDAEPDPKRLADLADLAEKDGVTTIFTETHVSPEIAETLAREAGGIRTAVLDPFEGSTEADRAKGAGYVSVMRRNLEALRSGLGCR